MSTPAILRRRLFRQVRSIEQGTLSRSGTLLARHGVGCGDGPEPAQSVDVKWDHKKDAK
jgi:hypothetical protein